MPNQNLKKPNLTSLFLKAICLILITSNANATELCGQKVQGEILLGHAPNAKQASLNNKKIPLTKNGDFLIAFGRDENKKQSLVIDNKVYDFSVSPQEWDIQNIKGLPQKTVTPSAKDQKEINKEYKDVRTAQKEINSSTFWQKGFIIPVDGRISGKFGGQRIMNGEKKNPHQGTDIAAPEGTKIKASSDGTITLSSGPYFYSGNVVVIDHGHGLYTIYAHMKDLYLKTGDKVKQGDIIGTVGKTGRATGAHLHWGASLQGTRFAPQSLLELNNNSCLNL